MGQLLVLTELGCWFSVWNKGINFSLSNRIHSFPLGFEIDGSCVPVINFCGDCIHSIDSFHKGRWESSRKEVDQGVFMGYFAEGDLVLELRYIISKW